MSNSIGLSELFQSKNRNMKQMKRRGFRLFMWSYESESGLVERIGNNPRIGRLKFPRCPLRSKCLCDEGEIMAAINNETPGDRFVLPFTSKHTTSPNSADAKGCARITFLEQTASKEIESVRSCVTNAHQTNAADKSQRGIGDEREQSSLHAKKSDISKCV
jgi:hypothetical protein